MLNCMHLVNLLFFCAPTSGFMHKAANEEEEYVCHAKQTRYP